MSLHHRDEEQLMTWAEDIATSLKSIADSLVKLTSDKKEDT